MSIRKTLFSAAVILAALAGCKKADEVPKPTTEAAPVSTPAPMTPAAPNTAAPSTPPADTSTPQTAPGGAGK